MAGRTRIVFVTFSFGWGGTEKHLEQLVMRLNPKRVECVIVCFGPSVYRRSLNGRYGIDVPIVDAEGTSSFAGYWQTIRRVRPNVVVFVNGKLGLFPWYAYLAARLSGAGRVIAIEHLQGEPPPPMVYQRGPLKLVRRWFGWRARTMLGINSCGYLAHRTICVSRAVRDTVVGDYGYPADKTITIVNGIDVPYYTRSARDPAAIRQCLGLPQGVNLLVYVARLGRLKRIDILLEAVALLRARRCEYACVIVGEGNLRDDLWAKAEALKITDVVHFVGHAEDVRPYLEAGDVYVSTAEREGFGLAVAEAMAMGLVCVVTDIGGHDEMIVHGVTGLMVPVDSPTEVVKAVEFVLEQEDARCRMRKAARQRIEAEFSLDQMVRKIETVLLS